VKRPGTGPIHADSLNRVVGKRAATDIPADVHVTPDNIVGY
jgi:hypothetical protein